MKTTPLLIRRLFFFLVSVISSLAVSLSEGAPRYSVTVLPTGVLNTPKINDKGQVIGVEGDKIVKLYLPAPDYDIATAGVHTFPLSPEITQVRFTDFNNNSNTIGTLKSTATSDRWFYSLDGITYTSLNDIAPVRINDQARILGYNSLGTTIVYEGFRTHYREILDHIPLHPVSIAPSNSEGAELPNQAISFIATDINDSGRMAGHRVDPLYAGRRLSTDSYIDNGVYVYLDAEPGEPVLSPGSFDYPHRFVTHRPFTMPLDGTPSLLSGFPSVVAEFPEGPYFDVYGIDRFSESFVFGINNRNEVFGFINILNDNSGGWVGRFPWVHLPEAAYGLSVGLNILENFYIDFTPVTGDSFAVKVTDSGDIFAPRGAIADPSRHWTNPAYPDFTHWRRGELFNVAENLSTSGQEVVLLDWHDINNGGVILATGTVDGGEPTLLLLDPAGVNLRIDVPTDDLDVGVETTATITVTSDLPESATITLNNPLLTVDNTEMMDITSAGTISPFVLSPQDPEWEFSVPIRILKKGIAELSASGIALPSAGEEIQLEATFSLEVSPMTVAVTITNKEHQWNTTAETEWGARARAINQQRRDAGFEGYRNLIELELQATNNSIDPITNVNIPGVRNILSYIQSTDAENPTVPLLPVRLFAPGGVEVDLTNPEDTTELTMVTLNKGETATFAWVVEAFQIDPETPDIRRPGIYSARFGQPVRSQPAGINSRNVQY